MPNIVFEPATRVTRERLIAAFAAANIDARVFFYPLSSLPMFEGYAGGALAADIPTRAFNLPSFHDITDEEQQRVVRVLREVLGA
jgi:perosamine synthetase